MHRPLLLPPVLAKASSTLIAGGGLIGILSLLAFLSGNGKRRKLPLVLLVFLILSVALMLSGCVDEQPVDEETGGRMLSYSVPVELKNEIKDYRRDNNADEIKFDF